MAVLDEVSARIGAGGADFSRLPRRLLPIHSKISTKKLRFVAGIRQ